jgi:hypothetical protein
MIKINMFKIMKKAVDSIGILKKPTLSEGEKPTKKLFKTSIKRLKNKGLFGKKKEKNQ